MAFLLELSSHKTADGVFDTQVKYYRLLSVAAGVLVLAFGIVQNHGSPSMVDPFWLRAILAGLCFGVAVLSYMSSYIRQHFFRFVQAGCYVLTTWYFSVAAYNGFSAEYAIGVPVVIFSMSIVLRLGRDRVRPSLYYFTFSVGCAAFMLFVLPRLVSIPMWQASPWIVLGNVVSTGALAYYVATRWSTKVQRDLAHSRQRFAAAAEGSLDAFFMLDSLRNECGEIVDFSFADANLRGERLLGVEREQIIGEQLRDFFRVERIESFVRRAAEVVETGRPVEREVENTIPQISAAWLRYQVIKVRDGIAVTVRDVTERRQTEEAVKASERRYRTLMEAASDAIFVADADTGMIVDANRKAQTLTGRSLEELRQMRQLDLHQGKAGDGKPLLQTYEQADLTEDLVVVDRSGRHIPVDVSASAIELGDKYLVHTIFHDITQRHQYEAQLIEAKEHAEEMLHLKTSFLNNMSHEIRTPITSILGYAQILAEEIEGRHEDFARTISQSAERLQKTLDSVLDLAQLQSGRATLTHDEIEVIEEVEGVLSLLKPLASEKGIGLRTEARAPAITAQMDSTCLNRIVNNLVGNAIKFTEEGHVVVEIDEDDGHLLLHVHDTGIGIGAEFQEYLFEEFRQESTGLTRSHEGNGLGLAITHRLVELLGGTIAVESEKGVGTTFTVTLPRNIETEAEASIRTSEGADTQSPVPSSSRILVVEDNVDTRNLVHYQLRQAYRVETAADAGEALDHAADADFDLLLLDINLGPSMGGVDLLHALREKAGYRDVPAVAMTAYAMPGDQDRFLEEGFDAYLSKPFTRQELMEVVERALHTRSQVHV